MRGSHAVPRHSTGSDVATAQTVLEPQTAQPQKTLLQYLGTAVVSALLVLVVGLGMLAIVVPAVVGGSALTVLTQSMEPTLPPGTLIIIRPTAVKDIRVGTVLTYQIESDRPELETHRVIEKSTDTRGRTTFVTQGDNNDLPDSPAVRPVQVKGTLWYSIPWLGYVNNLVGGSARAIVIPIAAGALFVYAGYMVISAVLGGRRKRATDTREG